MDKKQQQRFVANLDREIKEKYETQQEFAEKIGISKAYLSQILNMKRKGTNVILEICEGLNVPISLMVEDLDPDILIITKYAKELQQAERQETIRYLQEKKQLEEFRKLKKQGNT